MGLLGGFRPLNLKNKLILINRMAVYNIKSFRSFLNLGLLFYWILVLFIVKKPKVKAPRLNKHAPYILILKKEIFFKRHNGVEN